MTRTPRLTVLHVLAIAAVVAAGCATEEADDGDPADYVVTEEDQAEDDLFVQSMDGKADGPLGYAAVARVAKNAGLSCTGERIAIAVAVAKAESGLRPDARNTAGNAHGVDRGLWQINSYWHPSVSAACAFSPSCNARAMARISSKGTSWRPWWTYVHRKHVPFMSQARAAQNAVCP